MPGHPTTSCPLSPTTADVNILKEELIEMADATVAFTMVADRENKYKETEARFGKCPTCSIHHTYRRTVGGEEFDWPSCRFS